MTIPKNAIAAVETELSDLKFGSVTLELQANVHDGKVKWRLIKTVSITELPTSGETPPQGTGTKKNT